MEGFLDFGTAILVIELAFEFALRAFLLLVVGAIWLCVVSWGLVFVMFFFVEGPLLLLPPFTQRSPQFLGALFLFGANQTRRKQEKD